MPMPILVVYVTTSTRDEALNIGRIVVGERLGRVRQRRGRRPLHLLVGR